MSTPDQSLFARLLHVLGRRGTEQTLRQSIAELVEEAAVSPEGSDEAPELDRQERLLIANILRLRGTMRMT